MFTDSGLLCFYPHTSAAAIGSVRLHHDRCYRFATGANDFKLSAVGRSLVRSINDCGFVLADLLLMDVNYVLHVDNFNASAGSASATMVLGCLAQTL
jgi:hypothetical protein